jgi:hypothetical protein
VSDEVFTLQVFDLGMIRIVTLGRPLQRIAAQLVETGKSLVGLGLQPTSRFSNDQFANPMQGI